MDSQHEQLSKILGRSSLWAIRPDAFARLLVGMTHGLLGDLLSWEAAKPQTHGKGNNKIAVIPIQGVLTKDGPSWLGTNYDGITESAEQAAADPTVKRIVLAVDSPGGEVTGLPEAAAVLAQVRKVKPVSAIVEGQAASAAYWLTSQAHDIAVTPSGEVGSVGVRMTHVDISEALTREGIKVTELYSGNFKTEWSPYKPLSDEAVGNMQERLTSAHNDFINAVAEGRGVRATADTKADRFGEGRMFSAQEAMGKGMSDTVQSPREFYRAVMPVQEEEATTSPADLMRRRAAIAMERERF